MVQRQVPSIETVQKTVEVPQTQHIDKVADVPVARPRQTPIILKVQRTVETPRIQFMDRVVDVPVMAHSQTLSVQRVQKTMEVPQIQFIDKLVDSHVNMRSVSEVEHVVPTPVTEHMASAPAQSHADVSAGVKSDITWTKELTEIRQMVEFLVRRERKLDVKTDMAVRRLERLEREQDEQDDHDREASMTEALADKTKVVKLVVDKWFVDKGFGFGRSPTGDIVFIHSSVVHGGEVLMIGTDAWAQVVSDNARAEGRCRARNAWGRNAWKEEKEKEKANRVAQQVKRAAALTAELSCQSERKVSAMCDHAPGLRDEPAEHSAAPNVGAGGSHHQAATTCSPLSASPLCASSPLPTGKSFNLAGGFREGRPRQATRAQETAALIDETIGFCIKVTGSDEGPIRRKLMTGKPEDIRRERDLWKTRSEEHERFQSKKEEAWELFGRQSSFKQRTREEFEEEFKQENSGCSLWQTRQEGGAREELAEMDE